MKKKLGCLTRGIAVLVMLGVIAAIAASYLGGDDDATDVAIRGVVVIESGEDWETSSEGCVGAGAFSDIHPGQSVTVQDASDDGRSVTTEIISGSAFDDGGCSLVFDANAHDAETYSITIGDSVTATCNADVFADINGTKAVDIVVTSDGATCRNAREH